MNIEVREFQSGDEAAFRALNEAWIIANFVLEEQDRTTLRDPRRYILDPGGHIYFAFDPETGERLACCALVVIGDRSYEVAKMTVAEKWRGRGIGRKLLHAVIEAARSLGATYLYLETNHSLRNAIELYRSEGFEHLRQQDVKPSHYSRATVFMERRL